MKQSWVLVVLITGSDAAGGALLQHTCTITPTYNHTHTERGGRETEREQGGDTPFALDKNPLTPTYPWLLSSMGKGKISILSGSGLFFSSSSNLDALIFTPGLARCCATCWSWGRWCINTSPSIAGIDHDSVGIYLERQSNEKQSKINITL